MTIWTTPQPIFDALNREFHFVVDLCADLGNNKVARYMPRESSLSNNWNGRGAAWLNPPYGKEIAEWTKKASETDRVIVALLPGRTNPPWWHDHVMKAREIRFVRGKVNFVSTDKKGTTAMFGSVIVIWGPWIKQSHPDCVSWDWR